MIITIDENIVRETSQGVGIGIGHWEKQAMIQGRASEKNQHNSRKSLQAAS